MRKGDGRGRKNLQILVRDNAGELKSADLMQYIESLGAKNYFSMAYEQHQNGQAESSINSIMLLNTNGWVGINGRIQVLSSACQC